MKIKIHQKDVEAKHVEADTEDSRFLISLTTEQDVWATPAQVGWTDHVSSHSEDDEPSPDSYADHVFADDPFDQPSVDIQESWLGEPF